MDRLLVALDGSDHGDKALAIAADLAEVHGAEVLLVHVITSAPLNDNERQLAAAEYADELAAWATTRTRVGEPDDEDYGHRLLMHYSDLAFHFRETMGKRMLDSAKNKLHERKIDKFQIMLVEGDPASTIVALADDRKVDAILMGSRGLSDIKGLFLGSVSHKINHLASCTCITVK